MQLLMPGKPIPATAGRYVVQLSVTDSGTFRIETLSGGPVATRIDTLTASLADEGLARTIARVITVALRKQDATVEDARRAVTQHLDGQLAFLLDSPSIQATNSAAYLQMVKAMFESPEDTAALEELAADMVAFHRALAGTKPEATGLAALKPNVTRQVRMTLGGAQNADLTPAQRDALAVAQANGGTVLRGRANPLPVLRALVRKRLADFNYQPGTSRRIPVSVTLTARGWSTAVAS